MLKKIRNSRLSGGVSVNTISIAMSEISYSSPASNDVENS
jgi:hypothetical protein